MTSQKKKKATLIPPPPDASASWEEQAAYFEKYQLEDLEAAGYTEPLTKDDQAFVNAVKKTATEAVASRKVRGQLNLALSLEQLDRFTKYANKRHIAPSTLAKSWILERLDVEAKEA